MTVIVADSSVWIDYFRDADNPETAVLDRLAAPRGETDVLIVSDLVLFEVLQGASSERVRADIDVLMRSFGVVETGGEDAVVVAASRYRALRARGVTIRKSVDVLIASWCIDNDAALLHSDRDFEPFKEAFGLKTI